MDAQSRPLLEPSRLSAYSFSLDLPVPAENADNFPIELSSASDSQLAQLCDSLFLELDSDMPDLRAMERYQTICDELALRQIISGVA